MSFGLQRVKEETGLDVYATLECQNGISELVTPEERESSIALMYSLESRLSDQIDDYLLPKLGDGESEALYGREQGNCPNSVFPIFWWPLTKQGSERKTLLYRNLGS